MLKDYQKELLILLEQCELEISNLYKLFAEKFPSHKTLWKSMLEEEINHAAYLNKFSSLAEEGKISFGEKTTKTYTVKAIIDDMKTRYQKAQANQYTLLNALSFSLNLEESIIEKKFYDYFFSNDSDITTMINKIKKETFEHRSKIKKSLEKEKNRR
jgi:LPS O-antigen subunit length determinant protein (WzzB/FepE family)